MRKKDASRKVFVCITALLFLLTNIAYAQLTNLDLPDRTGVKVVSNATLHGAFKSSEMIDTNIFLIKRTEGLIR